MSRYLGTDYEISVYSYFKVAMSKRRNEDEIDEESFDATKDLYKHDTEVTVVENRMMEFHHEKYFTIADVGLDLRIKVRANDYDEACEIASGIAESVDLPVGVSYFDCEAYDGEVTGEAIDYDYAVGE